MTPGVPPALPDSLPMGSGVFDSLGAGGFDEVLEVDVTLPPVEPVDSTGGTIDPLGCDVGFTVVSGALDSAVGVVPLDAAAGAELSGDDSDACGSLSVGALPSFKREDSPPPGVMNSLFLSEQPSAATKVSADATPYTRIPNVPGMSRPYTDAAPSETTSSRPLFHQPIGGGDGRKQTAVRAANCAFGAKSERPSVR
jgi:hypothetical protein